MKIGIIGGTGYVGLVTGLGFAACHHQVVCADIDEKKVEDLNRGILPLYEEGLEELLAKANKGNHIRFTSQIEEAVSHSDVLFIAVGTPESEGGDTDLTQLMAAIKLVSQFIKPHQLLVMKSTVPVGTCEKIKLLMYDYLKGKDCPFEIASNPEFLREGAAVKDFLFPERIIVGTESQRAAEMLQELYEPFHAPILLTDIRSAEMTKYACNAYLASRISFINEIAEICEKTNADIHSVIAGMKLDKRIGSAYLSPGPGFGGPCLSKDLKSLIHFSEKAKANVGLLKSVLYRNQLQISAIYQHLQNELENWRNPKIAIFGLSFKAGTNDTRNSPSLTLLQMLEKTNMKVVAYDPVVQVSDLPPSSCSLLASSAEEAALDADCIVLMTEWPQFKELDLPALYGRMRTPLIIDARNLLDESAVEAAGFRYIGMGIKGTRSEKEAGRKISALY